MADKLQIVQRGLQSSADRWWNRMPLLKTFALWLYSTFWCPTLHKNIPYNFSGQLLILITSTIFNSIIVSVFCKRSTVRKKIPNILLFNQAVADSFNGGVYGVICVTELLLLVSEREQTIPAIEHPSNTTFIVSIMSSLLLYAIIAIERFLCIYFPLWHRVRLTKRHIWNCVVIIWLVSIVLGVCYSVILFSLSDNTVPYVLIYILGTTLVVIITILFIATFIRAFLSLRSHQVNSATQNRHASFRKQLRLTGIFSIMFFIFAIVYIPITVVYNSSAKNYLLIQVMFTLLLITSVLDATLTIIFKKQFRVRQPQPQANINNNIAMQQKKASHKETTP